MKQPGIEGSIAKQPEFDVPIHTLEKAIGRPFYPESLKDLESVEWEPLYYALFDYHQANRIEPVKAPDTIRPNLSFVSPWDTGLLVERNSAHYTERSFIPRNGTSELPIDEIKRSLLFADAVVVDDPVFALCRALMCSRSPDQTSRSLVRALRELATLRPLMEKRLLRLTAFFPDPIQDWGRDVPDSGDGIVLGDVAAATSYRDARVLRLVAADQSVLGSPPIEHDRSRLLTRALMDKLGPDFEWYYRQAESLIYGSVDPDAYCPHLPNSFQLSVFQSLLAQNSRSLPDLDIDVVMDLNSGCAPDPERIEIGELLNIRRNEEVFADWRALVRDAVGRADVQKYGMSELTAFKKELKSEGRSWRTKYQKYNKGRLADIMTFAKEVSFRSFKSVALGSVSTLLEPSGLMALGSLFFGLYKSARALESAIDRRSAEAAALSFFTAFQETQHS